MKKRSVLAAAALVLASTSVASAAEQKECRLTTLRGEYIFSASGFTRPAAGFPWVPKALVEVMRFDGDGTVATPALTVVNPGGDAGAVISPPGGGSTGSYTVHESCTGTINFGDGVAFNIYVAPLGNELWLIQTHSSNAFPSQNVFQGHAKRVWM